MFHRNDRSELHFSPGSCSSDHPYLERTVKLNILKRESIKRTCRNRATQPAFWPAALLRRTSVLPQAKPRYRRNSFPSSILNQRVEAAFGGWNPKQNATAFAVAFCFGPSAEIRTQGLLNPIQARYQTSPHPDLSPSRCLTRTAYIDYHSSP